MSYILNDHIYLFIYLFIYTLFKVDLHITLKQKPINIYLLYKHRAVNKKM